MKMLCAGFGAEHFCGGDDFLKPRNRASAPVVWAAVLLAILRYKGT